MLGRRAREAALETPLPSVALRVDHEFAERINAALVASLGAAVAADAAVVVEVADTAALTERTQLTTHPTDPDVDQSILASSGQDTGTPTSNQPAEVPLAGEAGLLQALELALGGGPLTVDRILTWGELAERGQRAATNRDAIASPARHL
jgi:hypothetical protein